MGMEVLPDALPMFKTPPHFMLGVADLEQLPNTTRSEVCFAGRSNVGKSSLINALFGRSDVARVSNTPGRTQQLNYFDVGGFFRLVDMPGYGYAKVSKVQRAEWNALIFNYLAGRPNLRRVFVLMDSRNPLQKNDTAMMQLLAKAAVPFQVVLTKCDQLKPAELEKIQADVLAHLKKQSAGLLDILCVSSKQQQGILELQQALLDACGIVL